MLCLLCWLGRLPSNKSLTPFLLIPPNSQHLYSNFSKCLRLIYMAPLCWLGRAPVSFTFQTRQNPPTASSPPPFSIFFKYDLSVDDRVSNLSLENLIFGNCQQISVKNGYICQFAFLQRSPDVMLECGISIVDRVCL